MNLKEALIKSQNICSKQEKCILDIKNKMRDWKVTEDDQDKIIAILIKERFIDEKRYALSFVHDKFHFNKWGKLKIRYHLTQKKISDHNIEEVLQEIDQSEYMQTLKQLLIQKQKSVKNKDARTQYKKLLSFAYNRGFSYDECHEMIKEILNN